MGDDGIEAIAPGAADRAVGERRDCWTGRVGQVILNDPPTTHRSASAPALLNVLRVTDLPEVAAAFAPRRLVFVTEVPPPFGAATRAYGLHGAGDRLKTAGSLAEAMRGWGD